MTPDALLATYGPIAFGLVALLTLWAQIVRPELEASRKEGKETAKQNAENIAAMRNVAEANKTAAEACRAAVSELHKLLTENNRNAPSS